MRRLGSAALLGGGQQVALPAGVEELLVDVVADGFALYRCGPEDAPRALVACYQWPHYVDLLTIGDFARVVTARVPTAGLPVNIFAPHIVVWAYEGPPQHAVPALLDLGAPRSSRCPHHELPRTRGLASAPRPATPHDDPAPVARTRRGAG